MLDFPNTYYKGLYRVVIQLCNDLCISVTYWSTWVEKKGFVINMWWFHYKSVVRIASNPLVGVILQYLAVFERYLTSIPVIPVNNGKIPGYCGIAGNTGILWYGMGRVGKNTGYRSISMVFWKSRWKKYRCSMVFCSEESNTILYHTGTTLEATAKKCVINPSEPANEVA